MEMIIREMRLLLIKISIKRHHQEIIRLIK
jgi:hypothetical protein